MRDKARSSNEPGESETSFDSSRSSAHLKRNPFNRPWMEHVGAAAPEHSQSHVLIKALITGGITGGLELLVAYPLEYLKTQLQFEEKTKIGQLKAPGSLKNVANYTYQKYGLGGFYRGIGVMLVGNVPKAAARFGTFELTRQMFGDNDGKMSHSIMFLGGILAGFMESVLVVAPMETIKVKVIHDLNREKQRYRGSFHTIVTILKEDGVRGTYQGLLATIVKQSTNQGCRFLIMESFRDNYQTKHKGAEVPTYLTVIWAIGTTLFTAYLNAPVDVVKTRMQGLERARYKNSFDCILQLLTEEGIRAFYKGALTRFFRMSIDTVISFTLYDRCMNELGKIWP